MFLTTCKTIFIAATMLLNSARLFEKRSRKNLLTFRTLYKGLLF